MKLLKLNFLFLVVFLVLAGAACSRQDAAFSTKNNNDILNQEQQRDQKSFDSEGTQQIQEKVKMLDEGLQNEDLGQGDLDLQSNTNNSPDVDESTSLEVKQPETKVFNITMRRFQFSPSSITVNQGDRVVFNVTSEDVTHGLQLADFGLNLISPVGQTVTGEFVASQPGTYTYRCSVFCGSGHGGMKGTLIVK